MIIGKDVPYVVYWHTITELHFMKCLTASRGKCRKKFCIVRCVMISPICHVSGIVYLLTERFLEVYSDIFIIYYQRYIKDIFFKSIHDIIHADPALDRSSSSVVD